MVRSQDTNPQQHNNITTKQQQQTNLATTSTAKITMAHQTPNSASGNTTIAKKREKVIAGTTETGTPPMVPSGNVQTMIFKFHNFAELPHGPGNYTRSKTIKCHGYDWYLDLFPGVPGVWNDPVGFTSFSLYGLNMICEVKAVVTFRCGIWEALSEPTIINLGLGFGWQTREETIQRFLDSNGSLTLEVDLDIFVPKTKVWYPKIIKDGPFLSKLYNEEDVTNVTFDVNGKKFNFHRLVLKLRAPGLYEAVQEWQGRGYITISNVDENVFNVIRKYIYTVLDFEMADLWESLDTTTTILVAADKFECTPLKLYAESILVEKFLTPDSCAMLLVLADSHSCPLLKEAGQRVYKNNPEAVSKSDGWNDFIVDCPKLLGDLLHYCTTVEPSYDENNVETWDVTTLRTKLQDSDMEICDGSKEMLVKQWKNQGTT